MKEISLYERFPLFLPKIKQMKQSIFTVMSLWFVSTFSLSTFQVQEVLGGQEQTFQKFHIEIENPKYKTFELTQIWFKDHFIQLNSIEQTQNGNPIIIDITEKIARNTQKDNAPIQSKSNAIITYKNEKGKIKYFEVDDIKYLTPIISR